MAPDNKNLLIGLIDYYCSGTDVDNDTVIGLIERVMELDPSNCELFYLKGDFHVRNKENDKALECFARSFELNPQYEYGLIGSGSVWYQRALDVLEDASKEVDDKAFVGLAEQFRSCLLKSSDYFEKAYELSTDKEVKLHTAKYLRNIWHRFASIDTAAADKYAYYSKIVGEEI